MAQCFLLIKFTRLSHWVLFFLSFSFVVFFDLPAQAAVFDDIAEEEPLPVWSLSFETGFIFDDNVFQQKVSKQSDVISESSVFVGYETGTVFLSALLIINRYREHDVLNDSYYEIGIEVPLGVRNTGSLFLNFSPTAPLDKADAGPPFELASRGFNFILDHEMSWGSIGFSFAVTRLNYSRSFEAKDSEIIALGPTLFYALTEDWSLSGDAAFERGRAAGGLIDARPDDISYRAMVLSFQTRYYFSQGLNLGLRYYFRNKRFTSTVDNTHRGRSDITQGLGFYPEIRIFPSLVFRLGFEETWVISEKNPEVEFRARRGSFSLAYLF